MYSLPFLFTYGEDEQLLKQMQPWLEIIEGYGNRIVGYSKVYLQQQECAFGECNLGNFYTDAMLNAFLKFAPYNPKEWSNISIALTTQGNFRVPIPKGNISYSQLVTMCPWENKLYALTLKGAIIKELLEDSVAAMNPSHLKPRSSRFLQVSGLHITYNISKPTLQKVIDVQVRCRFCQIPKYEPLDPRKNYNVVVMEYLADGKNGFHLISDNARHKLQGPEDTEALINFMEHNNPITAGLEGRVTVLK